MYNISELQAMPDDTLKSVAEGMGLKKVNPAKREELIYRILDEQAIVLSANAPEEAPRRRGRRPKNQSSPDTSKANPDKIQNAQSQLGDEPDATQDSNATPKRRGRKPKNKDLESVSEASDASEQTTGDPDNTEADQDTDISMAQDASPKKRGRKPKNRTIEETTPAEPASANLLPAYQAPSNESSDSPEDLAPMMVANPDEITGINEPEQVSESDKNAKNMTLIQKQRQTEPRRRHRNRDNKITGTGCLHHAITKMHPTPITVTNHSIAPTNHAYSVGRSTNHSVHSSHMPQAKASHRVRNVNVKKLPLLPLPPLL